jgi:hypothetical protein
MACFVEQIAWIKQSLFVYHQDAVLYRNARQKGVFQPVNGSYFEADA